MFVFSKSEEPYKVGIVSFKDDDFDFVVKIYLN